MLSSRHPKHIPNTYTQVSPPKNPKRDRPAAATARPHPSPQFSCSPPPHALARSPDTNPAPQAPVFRSPARTLDLTRPDRSSSTHHPSNPPPPAAPMHPSARAQYPSPSTPSSAAAVSLPLLPPKANG